jgi:GxxExxY protein
MLIKVLRLSHQQSLPLGADSHPKRDQRKWKDSQVKKEKSFELNEDRISRHNVDSVIEVHRTLGGPGLLESVYEEALIWELNQRGLFVERQVCLPILYKGQKLHSCFRIDLVINGKVIVECKAVSTYNPIFGAQILTYLRLSSLKLGMVINFGEQMVKMAFIG